VWKGRTIREASEAESESEDGKKGSETETGVEKSERQEEVIGQLQVLEQKVNVSEILLQTLLRDRLSQLASQMVEEFATRLSTPAPRPSTLEEARGHLESQMGVIHSLQLDAWREFRRSARWLKQTEEEEE